MADSFHPPRHLYYDGQIQAASSGKVIRTVNPATAQPLADVFSASHADIISAIASARTAFRVWSTTPPVARARILLKAVQLLRERNDEIAACMGVYQEGGARRVRWDWSVELPHTDVC